MKPITQRPTFRRARSDEQRAERREAILATATALLDGHRVADLSLNELSRQVGLAKSNVLHYFESREAILLELYDREWRAWLDQLAARLANEDAGGGHTDAIEIVAEAIAATVAARPLFCELTASAASVLEHNVSAEVAATYKRSAITNSQRLADIVGARLGEFSYPAGLVFIASVNLIIGGVWAMSQPSPGMAAAYVAYPELRSLAFDLRHSVRELVATVLAGLQQRAPSMPPDHKTQP
jgi:AcrR family transcriptional regulator